MCKYCDKNIKNILMFNGEAQVGIGSDCIYLYDEMFGTYHTFEINYCPMCGKKLDDDIDKHIPRID